MCTPGPILPLLPLERATSWSHDLQISITQLAEHCVPASFGEEGAPTSIPTVFWGTGTGFWHTSSHLDPSVGLYGWMSTPYSSPMSPVLPVCPPHSLSRRPSLVPCVCVSIAGANHFGGGPLTSAQDVSGHAFWRASEHCCTLIRLPKTAGSPNYMALNKVGIENGCRTWLFPTTGSPKVAHKWAG